MTVEEMRTEIDDYCNRRYSCKSDERLDACPLYNGGGCSLCSGDDATRSAYYTIFGKPPVDAPIEEEQTEVENDVIKHPNHYCRENAMECIDEMVLVFGKEVVKHFCLCNIWKYRYRSSAKNGEEDIKKSDRYIQIYKELTSNE